MRAPVGELFELHRELDVGQRAAAELEVELRVFARRDALALDPRLHPPHLASPLFRKRVAVDEAVGQLDEAFAELDVARHEPRFGERLELPRLRPLREVRLVAAERTRERALRAFGTQARVDAERASLRRAVADRAARVVSQCVPPSTKSGAVVPSYTKITSMSDAYESSAPPRRPRPITANGRVGSSERSAPSTHASARRESSRPAVSSVAKPSTSRAPIRRRWRRLKRRRPDRRPASSSRQSSESSASVTSSLRVDS